ncbi:MAG TPA: glycosyltransferase family 9 protein [Candidatus Margulisiibacteriota bacterium]|nr:glycosyltransferase family 9 protein [Candidatus Margulisiibacteriota bacterium]
MSLRFDFEVMQAIDHWVGMPICFLIGIWELFKKALFFWRKPSRSEEPKTILILKWFGLGSIVLMRDLVNSIHKRYPRAKVVFATFKTHRELIHSLFPVDKILAIDNKTPFSFLRDTFKVLWALSFEKIDYALDLEFYSKFSTLVTYLSGAPVRVGFYSVSFWRKQIITHPVYFNYFRHITGIYKMAGRVIDVSVDEPSSSHMEVSREHLEAAKDKLKKHGWNGRDKLIGVNPNAGELAYCRRWPKDYFIELINNLSTFEGFTVLLVGSGSEKEYTSSIYAALDKNSRAKVINTAGLLNITEFIALLSSLFLFITNDSGPLHLAVLQGTPTISIWGPQTPLLYGAKDKKRHREFYSNMDCSPCMTIYRTKAGFFCNGQANCLKGILPVEVLEYAVSLIKDKS